MARTGRPKKHEAPRRMVLLRLPSEELEAIDAQPGAVRVDKIRDLIREALVRRAS